MKKLMLMIVLTACSISLSAVDADAAWLKKFDALQRNFTKIGQLQKELNEMDQEVAAKTVEAVNAQDGILKVKKNDDGKWEFFVSSALSPFTLPEDCFRTPALSAPANR